MTTPARVTPQEIYPRVKSGEALLVCAYADEARCRGMQLEGSLTLQEFQAKLPDLPQYQEIVFFCA
ncbi:MAG: hypothetical protein P8X65_05805 [Syntrophobacterales bacterium]|jgi:hypothetical protein